MMNFERNDDFSNMYFANEIRFDGIVRLATSVRDAIRSHFVSMPYSTALRDVSPRLA